MRRFLTSAGFAFSLLFVSSTAFAQASITGVVRDTSGAVLPGVTVEATSPALIEKVRSVTTDRTGQYAIVDLNSSNGTFVNGEKITKRILKNGDEIAIGTVRLIFELPAPEEKRAPARKGLDDAFGTAKKGEGQPAAAGAAGGKASDIVLKSHQPIQVHRIKPGSPLLGIDLDQLSDMGKIVVYVGILAAFAGLMYLAYMLVTG